MTAIQISIDPFVVAETLLSAVGAIAVVVGAVAAIEGSPHSGGIPAATKQGIETFPTSRGLSTTASAREKASDPLQPRASLFLTQPLALLRIEIAKTGLDGRGRNRPCVQASPADFSGLTGTKGRTALVIR